MGGCASIPSFKKIHSKRGTTLNSNLNESDNFYRDHTLQINRLKLEEPDGVIYTQTTCMEIFPEELWEMILDTMEDSKDIQSVLAAFPELDELFHGRKTHWFFDQVFPHIFKQFNGFFLSSNVKTLLALRQASKRWCNVTESFFKNHPARHPYNPNGINRRNVSYGQFNYTEEATQLLTLEGTKIIKTYYNKMLNHSRNPFIFGRLCIDNSMQGTPHEQFLDASLLFLKNCGHHISHFEFTVEVSTNQRFGVKQMESLFRMIFECISCTRNVQFLRINLLNEGNNFGDILGAMLRSRFAKAIRPLPTYSEAMEELFYAKFANVIPQLPNLDTLIVGDLSNEGYDYLSNAFAVSSWFNKLKRLEVQIDSSVFLNSEVFPNLSELCLQFCGNFDLNFDSLDFLNNVNYPVLRKLSFTTNDNTNICITKLFGLFTRLEIEEMLLLGNWKVASDENCNLKSISSIKYFRVGDALDHDFEFLKMFTSLEHLHLHFPESDDVTAEKIEAMTVYCRRDKGFSSQLRSYMYEKFVPEYVNVWEGLPALKMLTVEKHMEAKEGRCWQYARECGNKQFQIQCHSVDKCEHDYNYDSEDSSFCQCQI